MAQEHSFDIVSKVDLQELKNALQQARKELTTRYDFKGSNASIEFEEECIVLSAEDEQHLKAVVEILQSKLVKRGIPLKALIFGKNEAAAGSMRRQKIELQDGIPKEKAREIVKIIKTQKLKVQASIQGEQVRVSGKKLDDLQTIMGLLKKENLEINMDFENFR